MFKGVIVGRAVKDFEIRPSKGDTVWGTVSVASNRSYIPKGEEKPGVDYVEIQIFGKFAETCADYITRGTQITATGELEIRRSTDAKGKEYTNVVMVNADLQWYR